MSSLTNDERLNLQKMVSEMDAGDNTNNIRKLKHSILIRDDVRKLDTFKKANIMLRIDNLDQFTELARAECPFLYANYTDIFNRILKDELDLEILTKLLIILKMIEDGKVDQHEGSVMVGKVLKELYVDSALKSAEKLDALVPDVVDMGDLKESKQLSWKEYKLMQK